MRKRTRMWMNPPRELTSGNRKHCQGFDPAVEALFLAHRHNVHSLVHRLLRDDVLVHHDWCDRGVGGHTPAGAIAVAVAD